LYEKLNTSDFKNSSTSNNLTLQSDLLSYLNKPGAKMQNFGQKVFKKKISLGKGIKKRPCG
jgi:hypothetical protein